MSGSLTWFGETKTAEKPSNGSAEAGNKTPKEAASPPSRRARIEVAGDEPGVAVLREGAVVRAWLGMTPQASYVTLSDSYGNVRGQLALTSEGPRLMMADEQRRVRARVELAAESPGIVLLDAQGQRRVWLGLAADTAYLGLIDSSGNAHGELSQGEDGPTLLLVDENLSPRAEMRITSAGPLIMFFSEDGQAHGAVGIDTDGAFFGLVDSSSAIPRAEVAVRANGACIILRDEKRNARAEVRTSDSGPGVAFLGDDGQVAAWFAANLCAPLFESQQLLRAHLGYGARGLELKFFDSTGMQRAELVTAADGPRLTLIGDRGKSRAVVHVGPNGPAIAFGK